ncbi:type III PLP-dependent enzyme [Sporomusa acidovorans]|uniref:ornithine decarboxylase n=1 Tax=Sporomusa acidovorans (strain ATCC 49682 / DSM 3132 / Mol) TaxID=1123286 RepID=A0ABZ3IW41_SPOA4|nr:type III PLP-dependent enzyme [Sporomusa acidovorans]OZC24024.1 lysine/ornithine decarboxylase [Sporomusa acidovorans DSM 3132]SDF58814.1 ornithine decarboxylase [Sporomusa acidovorans]
MKYFRLSQDAVKALADTYSTPLLVLSLEQIELNYHLLAENMPDVKIYYAVKANPDERIVRRLNAIGGYFDVASDGEMRMLQELNINPDRMVYANPVKTGSGLNVAHDVGVHKFTFDSESEIDKMAAAVPGGTVLLRIRVDNPHALVDLNKKFGALPEEALELLSKAQAAGLDVAGLCFHVGSQSTDDEAYLEALKICRQLFDAAAKRGMNLHILDIGGGFPIPTLTEEPDVAAMASGIYKAVRQFFPDTEIWAEPGRYICGTAVNLITQVIGTKVRNNQQWYFLDDGLYGTFSGVIFDHWDFELETFKTGKKVPSTFAGPSCDSLDIMFRDKPSVPLEIGDLILVPNCGAYTSASATVFNGFAKTQTVVWEEVYEAIQAKLELATAG